MKARIHYLLRRLEGCSYSRDKPPHCSDHKVRLIEVDVVATALGDDMLDIWHRAARCRCSLPFISHISGSPFASGQSYNVWRHTLPARNQ